MKNDDEAIADSLQILEARIAEFQREFRLAAETVTRLKLMQENARRADKARDQVLQTISEKLDRLERRMAPPGS